MRKIILFVSLNIVLLGASEVSQENLQSIYMEALLFLGVFGSMGIISYIYSNKHAKSYSKSNEEKERKEREQKKQKDVASRIKKLTLLKENGSITKEEFAILCNHHYQR